LLVVMPNGYGVSKGGVALPAQQALLDKLPQPGTNPANVVAAATRAVQRLAADAGVRVTVPKAGDSGSSTNRDRIIIAAAVAAALVASGAWRLVRRRARG
jgi:hypothetical protein